MGDNIAAANSRPASLRGPGCQPRGPQRQTAEQRDRERERGNKAARPRRAPPQCVQQLRRSSSSRSSGAPFLKRCRQSSHPPHGPGAPAGDGEGEGGWRAWRPWMQGRWAQPTAPLVSHLAPLSLIWPPPPIGQRLKLPVRRGQSRAHVARAAFLRSPVTTSERRVSEKLFLSEIELVSRSFSFSSSPRGLLSPTPSL